MFIYLFHRIDFLDEEYTLLMYMIYAQGASILISGLIMGLVVQTNNSLLKLGKITSVCHLVLLRGSIFLLTPVIPVVIILKALHLEAEKEHLVNTWRRNKRMARTTSVSRSWHSYRRLEMERRGILEAFADLKMVECSTEAIPQLFFLIILTFSSVEHSEGTGLSLLQDGEHHQEDISYIFLVVSLLQTITTIFMAITGALRIRKSGGLDLKSQVLLGLSATAQMLARLWLMVVCIVMALIQSSLWPNLTLLQTSLILCLPIPLHWLALLLLYARLNITTFWQLCCKEKLLHLLANSWVTIPVRRAEERQQVHKAREQVFSLGLIAINLTITGLAALLSTEVEGSLLLKLIGWPHLGFLGSLLELVLLPLILHLAGCGLLLLFYKTSHPWRQLGRERDRLCWGKLQGSKRGLQEETP